MKKLAIILTFVAATAMIFSSCGKYDEGPGISLLTKKARITGTWVQHEMTVNGILVDWDELEDLNNTEIKMTFDKDGTGKTTIVWGTVSISFGLEWEFNDSKESLKIREKDDEDGWDEWEEKTIIRLTNKELWVKDIEIEDGETIVTITKMKKE